MRTTHTVCLLFNNPCNSSQLKGGSIQQQQQLTVHPHQLEDALGRGPVRPAQLVHSVHKAAVQLRRPAQACLLRLSRRVGHCGGIGGAGRCGGLRGGGGGARSKDGGATAARCRAYDTCSSFTMQLLHAWHNTCCPVCPSQPCRNPSWCHIRASRLTDQLTCVWRERVRKLLHQRRLLVVVLLRVARQIGWERQAAGVQPS